jgi:hypothetical protein
MGTDPAFLLVNSHPFLNRLAIHCDTANRYSRQWVAKGDPDTGRSQDEHNRKITKRDLHADKTGHDQLNDDQLDRVSGGAIGETGTVKEPKPVPPRYW